MKYSNIDGLVQERRNSIANAIELRLSCTNPSIFAPFSQPRDGEPTVRILTADPINLKDDHFNRPLDKTDQLKAPDHFPPAVYRYTLREMSLVWYMYGGQDFESSEKSEFGVGRYYLSLVITQAFASKILNSIT